ncbi:MAG: glutaminase A [Hyphomonadaceae bacterium]
MSRQTSTAGKSAKRDAPIMEGPIVDYLRDLHFRVSRNQAGAVATYIPELAKANPNMCGIAIATVDGKVYAVGDCDHAFTIQSVSKPFVYGYALELYGRANVLRHVGVEPTGEAFNSIVLDDVHNRPFNPMVNAGAIATAELIRGETPEARVGAMEALFAKFAGRRLTMDEAVYLSEKETGHRNRAIAYMMLNSGMIRRDPEDILDIYFRQCSMLVTCRDLAIMGATLANDGLNPVSGQRAMGEDYIHDVLTVMNTCGMYNYAGQWSYEIGMPAKSGVSGSVLAVIPGQAGVAIFSPPIDENGNSVRGVEACREIAGEFGLHVFRTHPNARVVIRRELTGDVIRSKRARTLHERTILDESGKRICVVEVQDALFFGSTERLLRRAAELAETTSYLIFDLRRVYSADAAAHKLLIRFCEAMQARKKLVLFAHLHEDGPLAKLHADLINHADYPAGAIFESRDAALEWCENDLIAQSAPEHANAKLALGDLEIFRGLDADELKLLEGAARPLVFEAGSLIVKEGDPAQLFFVVAQGMASVRIKVRGEAGVRTIRLGSIGPGMSFGEMALLDGGRRSADVVADQRVLCYGFSVEELQELSREHPAILIKLLSNITRDMSERLRLANNEIRALEH